MEPIKITDLIGSTSAVSPRTGLKAYDYVAAKISQHIAVEIDFAGVQDLTSAFCNAFIGKLYMNFDLAFLNDALTFKGIGTDHIWNQKIQSAIYLGSNENARQLHQSQLEEVIVS